MPAGEQRVTWDGRDETGQMAPSGMYFYKYNGAGESASRKMTLVKQGHMSSRFWCQSMTPLDDTSSSVDFAGDDSEEILLVGGIPGEVGHALGMAAAVRAAVPFSGIIDGLVLVGMTFVRRMAKC